jgi:hypothetical protein
MDKEQIKQLLSKHVVSISFKKVDGTERKMLCSLKKDILPIVESKETTKKKPENENVLPVWDLEKNAFRSFRLDSLTNYSIVEEGYEL